VNLYQAVAQRLVDELDGAFQVSPFDHQLEGAAAAELADYHILVQYPEAAVFSPSAGGLGGQYMRKLTVRLIVKVLEDADAALGYLEQVAFLDNITRALHAWMPLSGLSAMTRRRQELGAAAADGTYRTHVLDFTVSGYDKPSNLSELGLALPPDYPVYLSIELITELG
jgi:hypothetical protein